MRMSDWISDLCSSDLPGASKDQVRLKLGNPHFSEGLFSVDQWNYILGLPSATGSGLLSCQYQVQFDKQHKVKATYWNTDDCSAAAAAPDDVAATGSEVPAAYGPNGEIKASSADGVFKFGRYGSGDHGATGRRKLAQIPEHTGNKRTKGHKRK